jgi:hypothetical protein
MGSDEAKTNKKLAAPETSPFLLATAFSRALSIICFHSEHKKNHGGKFNRRGRRRRRHHGETGARGSLSDVL